LTVDDVNRSQTIVGTIVISSNPLKI